MCGPLKNRRELCTGRLEQHFSTLQHGCDWERVVLSISRHVKLLNAKIRTTLSCPEIHGYIKFAPPPIIKSA